MTEVRPFRGLRYDPERVDLSRVIVPPYDVVNAAERAHFYERDPHNAIRLELTRDVADEATTDYREVAETLAAWQDEGVLRRDAEPAIYGLRQSFTAPDGTRLARDGFFAALRLEDYDRRVVLPHERTLRGPKADRLKMLRATEANVSSLFFLFEDREQELSRPLAGWLDAGPAVEATDESGIEHRLVPITDPDAIARVQRHLADQPVLIADGHHRYETALAYRDERRAAAGGTAEAPWDFTLGYFANAYAPGSLLLPIHRVVREVPPPDQEGWGTRLPTWAARAFEFGDPEFLTGLLKEYLEPIGDRHAFAADDGSGVLRIFSRSRRDPDELSIRVIHDEVLRGVFGLDAAAVRDGAVAFPKQASEAAAMVRRGEGTAALYLNPLTPEDVFRVTRAGDVLPQKSTFFYPKLPSGLVLRTFQEESG